MLPTSIPFTKEDYLQCIELFADNTTDLIEPMISFVGRGVMDKNEAIELINETPEKELPEGFVVCGRERDDQYWNSAYIFKHAVGFFVEPDNMVPIQTRYADNIKAAIVSAALTVADYQTIIDAE